MMLPYTKESYQLLHEGTLAMSQIEANGIRVDVPYLDKKIRQTQRRIRILQREIGDSKIVRKWKRKYRTKFNLNSGEQLGRMLFDVLGYDSPEKTESGKHKTDEESLSKLDIPFVQDYLQIKKLQKALSTYLIGIRREVADGLLHPFFNLNTAMTYRSSSENPNFQNIPVRDEEIGKLIRTAFIPRKGHRIVEADFKSAEVIVSACYNKDPRLIDYLRHPEKDMHRDMSMECYKLKQEQVTKQIRACGKGMFVFAQFYGDWYIDCARNLWDVIGKLGLKLEDGASLYDHLKANGIRKLGCLDPKESPLPGTFERHIQQVERKFWEQRFPIYDRWKKRWFNEYTKKGWFLTKTGFICQGLMKRNEVNNYPIQGSSFHCLLWSLIQIMEELKRRKMKSMIIGQIHDSAIGDVPDEEMDEFVEVLQEVIMKRLVQHWKWLILPMSIEVDATPVDGSWADKAPWKSKN